MGTFLVLSVAFIYFRYFIASVSDYYSLGNPEWIFPGVENSTVESYQYYFLVHLCMLALASLLSRPIQSPERLDFTPPTYLFVLIGVVALAGLYRGYLYTDILLREGYIATVDFLPPRALSLITGTFLKPLALFFALMHFLTYRLLWKVLFFGYAGIICLSWQRTDIIVVLIIYWCLSIAIARGRMKSGLLKSLAGPFAVFVLAFLIFFFREGVDGVWRKELLPELLWASGISVNPGLYVIENASEFRPGDVLGFPVTYFLCGVAKLFVQTCSSDARLELPGFFLEKITSSIGVNADGSFIGLGGNVVASFFVASRLTSMPTVNFLLFILFSAIFCLYVNYCFNKGAASVLGLLFISALLLAARSSLDGALPALNQILAAIFLDRLIRKYSLPAREKII